MDINQFKRTVRAFADYPEDIDIDRGRLLLQVRDIAIEATLSHGERGMLVTEDGDCLTAESWVVKRLARLPMLADRICDHDESPEHFVSPSGRLLGSQHNEPAVDQRAFHSDIAARMTDALGHRTPGEIAVWFLTSDAGEGKTSLIHRLAVQQARAYKRKEAGWLLVPIPLGGRTFLRFDDVVISALANRLRFQLLYYDAFLELIRLGVVVPAFDGFEEMIIEGSSGEAVSALGQLLKNLESAGTVLIATRKAYHEYKSFRSMAQLLDSILDVDVTFGSMSLHRWSRNQFIGYGKMRGVRRPDTLYKRVASALGDNEHPLLTRAVLIRRLMDVAKATDSDLSKLLGGLGTRAQDFFLDFLSAIVEREANEKWMDKSGEPTRPLLNLAEHHLILSRVSQEMWLQSTDDLRIDDIGVVAELFAEEQGMAPAVARQIQERLKQHALLVKTKGGRWLGFDHDDFRYFYLGFALGVELVKRDVTNVKAVLEVSTLPRFAVDQAVNYLSRTDKDGSRSALRLLQQLASREPAISFVRENCGSLTVALVDILNVRGVIASHMSFPVDALVGRTMRGVEVSDSHFSNTSLEGATLVDCKFQRCRFERLDGPAEKIENTSLIDCEIASVVYRDEDPEYGDIQLYDPAHIRRRLIQYGLEVEDGTKTQPRSGEPVNDISDDLKLVQRVLRTFTRTTRVNESTMQVRLGKKFARFEREILPKMLAIGVLVQETLSGKQNQRCLRIAMPMRRIEEAMVRAGGEFDRFVDALAV